MKNFDSSVKNTAFLRDRLVQDFFILFVSYKTDADMLQPTAISLRSLSIFAVFVCPSHPMLANESTARWEVSNFKCVDRNRYQPWSRVDLLASLVFQLLYKNVNVAPASQCNPHAPHLSD